MFTGEGVRSVICKGFTIGDTTYRGVSSCRLRLLVVIDYRLGLWSRDDSPIVLSPYRGHKEKRRSTGQQHGGRINRLKGRGRVINFWGYL